MIESVQLGSNLAQLSGMCVMTDRCKMVPAFGISKAADGIIIACDASGGPAGLMETLHQAAFCAKNLNRPG